MSTGLEKRANLAARVDKHDDAFEELNHLVLDEVGTNRQSIRQLEHQQNSKHPIVDELVARVVAIESRLEDAHRQLEQLRDRPWWRLPWW
jgi:porphobilinogen deaminase